MQKEHLTRVVEINTIFLAMTDLETPEQTLVGVKTANEVGLCPMN